jgi:hypothetical protein
LNNKKDQNSLMTIILVVLILSGAFFFIRATVNRTVSEPIVSITDTQLIISGMYGQSYSLADIQTVDIQEGTPQLGRKINGAGLNNRKAYRGVYIVEGIGESRVFLFGDQGPYIRMRIGEETLLVMFSQSQDTRDLYERILEAY